MLMTSGVLPTWQGHNFRLRLGTTRIEFDPDKEESNRQKHKYSLSCAVDVFESALLLQTAFVTSDPFMENDEVRHIHLADYRGRIVLIVTTMRDRETVRVLSMRDASDDECAIYRQNPPRLVG
jgi:uncharacterized DUF497 family protein